MLQVLKANQSKVIQCSMGHCALQQFRMVLKMLFSFQQLCNNSRENVLFPFFRGKSSKREFTHKGIHPQVESHLINEQQVERDNRQF